MPSMARLGDPSDHSGTITGPCSDNTICNGIKVSRLSVDGHTDPIHGTTQLATGSPDVIVNGQNVTRVTDIAGCAAAITAGSPDVIVNG